MREEKFQRAVATAIHHQPCADAGTHGARMKSRTSRVESRTQQPSCTRRSTLDVRRIFHDTPRSKMKTKVVKNAKTNGAVNERFYSSQVVDGTERAASRAMLYAVGFKKEDFRKP